MIIWNQILNWNPPNLTISPLYSTNRILFESSRHPLSTDPLTTFPSPTQTHQTHQTHSDSTRPERFFTLWRYWLCKPYICLEFMATTPTNPLTIHPSPAQTHQTHPEPTQPDLLPTPRCYTIQTISFLEAHNAHYPPTRWPDHPLIPY